MYDWLVQTSKYVVVVGTIGRKALNDRGDLIFQARDFFSKWTSIHPLSQTPDNQIFMSDF